LDGILSVIKPAGMTSFDVVAYIRNRFGGTKIGHTGTLDPDACGLMILCIGKATKMTGYMMASEKTYMAELRLGIRTDTLDSSGEVTSRTGYIYDRKRLGDILPVFIGGILQKPPMYSAVKINGRRLYESARKGIEVEREARQVFVRSISVTDDSDPQSIMLRITCSKGTYIRSLIADIGEQYGCGAHTGFLLRISDGPFNIACAYTLEEITQAAANGEAGHLMTDLEEYFGQKDKIVLNENEMKVFINGAFVKRADLTEIIEYAVFDPSGLFLGIGETIEKGTEVCLKAKRLL